MIEARQPCGAFSLLCGAEEVMIEENLAMTAFFLFREPLTGLMSRPTVIYFHFSHQLLFVGMHTQSQHEPLLSPAFYGIYGSEQTDTFFAHANTETLLQPTVLALVPVVLVNLTLSV